MILIKEAMRVFKRSLAERGAVGTLSRWRFGPQFLWNLSQSRLHKPVLSEFDRRYGVDTDGATGYGTSLCDLRIDSPNWVLGLNYIPVMPEQFHDALSSLVIPYEQFTFIDFGCGKGRALLLASEYPFQRLVGVDFAPELLAIAESNWAIYKSRTQRSTEVEFVCADFVTYQVPATPTVLYFYHPCAEPVMAKVVENVKVALARNFQRCAVVYVNPNYGVECYRKLWEESGMRLFQANPNFYIYIND